MHWIPLELIYVSVILPDQLTTFILFFYKIKNSINQISHLLCFLSHSQPFTHQTPKLHFYKLYEVLAFLPFQVSLIFNLQSMHLLISALFQQNIAVINSVFILLICRNKIIFNCTYWTYWLCITKLIFSSLFFNTTPFFFSRINILFYFT